MMRRRIWPHRTGSGGFPWIQSWQWCSSLCNTRCSEAISYWVMLWWKSLSFCLTANPEVLPVHFRSLLNPCGVFSSQNLFLIYILSSASITFFKTEHLALQYSRQYIGLCSKPIVLSRLKYLNKYYMDCLEILFRHSCCAEEKSYRLWWISDFPLVLPTGQSFHLFEIFQHLRDGLLDTFVHTFKLLSLWWFLHFLSSTIIRSKV